MDYVAADCSRPAKTANEAFTWVRQVVQAKQSDYVAVWDHCASPMATKWPLHTTAAQLAWKPGLITAHTEHGADLDLHVLAPQGDLPRDERKGPFGDWRYDAKVRRKSGDPYPFTHLKYVTLSAPPGVDFITVLHPRWTAGAPLTPTLFSQARDGVVIQVATPQGTDVITLTASGGSLRCGKAPRWPCP